MPIKELPEAVARGYAPVKSKILPFPKGTFFCESRNLIPYIGKLGHIAFTVRIYLASIAKHKDGIRSVKAHPKKIAEKVGCKERAVYKALKELKRKRFLLGSDSHWSLIEPSEETSGALPDAPKESPRQLYLF